MLKHNKYKCAVNVHLKWNTKIILNKFVNKNLFIKGKITKATMKINILIYSLKKGTPIKICSEIAFYISITKL